MRLPFHRLEPPRPYVAGQDEEIIDSSVGITLTHLGDPGWDQIRILVWNPRAGYWERAGWAKMMLIDGSTFLIADLEIFPQHQGRGYGTTLLHAAIELAMKSGAREILGHLSARDDVPRLKRWYEREGFSIVDPREKSMLASIVMHVATS